MSEKILQEETTKSAMLNPALVASGVHADFLKARIDVGTIVSQVYRSLGGIVWDPKTKTFIKVGEAMCPPQLLEKIASILTGYCNTNNIHGNITEQEAHDITFDLMESITFLLGFEGPSLNVRAEDLDLIILVIENIVYLTLTRAVNDGERSHEDDTFKSVQTNQNRLYEGGAKI